ncbi:hypothetical protein TNIN_95881 [Trichonephila inaurata madagascariensis]|uniref:Uncharacterized protein n=1 Tax=Trichonephila inaurata madagascariensis TaxID=2747483 RepID=A0A8X6X5U8_9ARAC|nr:hypothetical protein TNIN_95881 [Trichonephila inaurata madagascariensis]
MFKSTAYDVIQPYLTLLQDFAIRKTLKKFCCCLGIYTASKYFSYARSASQNIQEQTIYLIELCVCLLVGTLSLAITFACLADLIFCEEEKWEKERVEIEEQGIHR